MRSWLVAGLDTHPESSLVSSKFLLRDIISPLVAASGQMKKPVVDHLAAISLAELLKNPELVISMATLHPKLSITSFEQFAASVSSDWQQGPLASLVEYALPELDSLYSRAPSMPMSNLGPRLAAISSEWGRRFLAEVYVSAIFRHGFFFSKKGKERLIDDSNRVIEALERNLRGARDDKTRLELQEEIRWTEARLAFVSAADFSIAGDLAGLVSSAEASGITDARMMFQPIIERYVERFSSEYQGYGYRFREGDVFAHISSGGFGDLFMNLAQLPDFITHSGVYGAVSGQNFAAPMPIFPKTLLNVSIPSLPAMTA